MGSDRLTIIVQILKAIDYGNLSLDEIERRLEQIIEAELNVPFGTEIDHVKVKLCCSLLYKLDGLDEPDDAEIEKSKEAVRKRVIRRKNRLSM